MKVQYLQDYPDPSVKPGFVFKAGWTAEHDDPEAQRRIEAGVCIEVGKDVRPTRSERIIEACFPDAGISAIQSFENFESVPGSFQAVKSKRK